MSIQKVLNLEEKLATMQMMQLAETGFKEWNEEGEDIYDNIS
jgi:hypothetical protein